MQRKSLWRSNLIQHVLISLQNLTSDPDFPVPSYATPESAGVDLCAAIDQDTIIGPGQIQIVPTGVAIALPKGYEAQIRSRSGLAAKNGVVVLNSPGTIDADYRGEIKIILINHSKDAFVITPRMRIAQMVVSPYVMVAFDRAESLELTERGVKGFGSTGL